jgi:cell division protein FtsB
VNEAERAQILGLVHREIASLRAELLLSLRSARAELLAELAAEVDAITARIDGVHKAALRDLTARTQEGSRQ